MMYKAKVAVCSDIRTKHSTFIRIWNAFVYFRLQEKLQLKCHSFLETCHATKQEDSTFVDGIESFFYSSGGRKAQANSVGGVHVAFNKSYFTEGFILFVSQLRTYAQTHTNTYCSSDTGQQTHLQKGFGLPDCWLEVSIRKVLRPAISTQVFLGFPVPKSKCWDGSQDSKLPLHASHVALQT